MGKSFWQSPGGAAAISGIGSAGAGLFSGLFSIGSQRRQYKYNLALQKQQQEWQKTMWELQNEYNSPVNEIQRLLDAGVNPASAFGNAGGAAAPVPQSGSAGGAAAPTASMSNIGASAVQAAQEQQRLDNETKVAESTAEKNKAEADAARSSSGLYESMASWNNFKLGVDREIRPILVARPRLDYQFRQLNYALGYEEYTRSKIYTGNFPTLQNQQMQMGNIQLQNLRRTGDKLLAEINYLNSMKSLTDEEAKIARERVAIVALDALMARVSKRVYEDVFSTKYKRDDGSWGEYWEKLSDTVRNNVSERLQRSETGLIESGLDYDAQIEFGASIRRYNYETLRRGANKLRTDQYTSVINSLVGVGSSVIGGVASASANRFRGTLMRRWQSEGRRMGSTIPFGSYPDAAVPSYHGGEDYYPFHDF